MKCNYLISKIGAGVVVRSGKGNYVCAKTFGEYQDQFGTSNNCTRGYG